MRRKEKNIKGKERREEEGRDKRRGRGWGVVKIWEDYKINKMVDMKNKDV